MRPVTRAPATGGFIVQFVLPRSVTLDTAPQPLDERVMLREVPPSRVAAIRFSGFWSDADYNEHLALLQAALKDAGERWRWRGTMQGLRTRWRPIRAPREGQPQPVLAAAEAAEGI